MSTDELRRTTARPPRVHSVERAEAVLRVSDSGEVLSELSAVQLFYVRHGRLVVSG